MANILIVDDDPKMLEWIGSVAREAGYGPREIFKAGGESEAMGRIGDAAYQAAVVDVDLIKNSNSTNGLEVIGRLRSAQPECRIVALTTHMHECDSQALDKGADDFIYNEWAYINWRELLRNRLQMWRKARPRPFAVR